MERAGLRYALLAICALGMVLWVNNSFIFSRGESPVTVVPTAHGWTARLDGDAHIAGFRSGDRLDLSRASALQRWLYFSVIPKDERLTYYPKRNGSVSSVVVPVSGLTLTADVVFGVFAIGWMLLFAAIILIRGKPSRRTTLLAVILILWGITNQLWSGNLYTPWVALSALCDLCNFALNSLSVFFMIQYAQTFGAMTATRRILASVSIVAGAFIFLCAIAIDGGVLFDRPWWTWLGNAGQSLAWVISMFGTVACLIAAIASAGRERDEAIWASVPMAIIALFQGVVIGMSDFDLPGFFIVGPLTNIAFFIFPLGLTYASLARRVVDIGFALNRATVYSAVSLIVVTLFVLFEWVIGHWIDTVNRTASLALSGAVAVGLGLSINFIHARVDRALDTVFFRKRHEDELAIRAFAHEAAFITDPAVLRERTVAVLESRADASFARIIEGTGDDPALVALRAWHKPVDLATLEATAIDGEWVYPMVARGHLVAALVLGKKRSGDSYAPDEASAIRQLAHSVASALDVLHRSDDARLERIELLLEALPQRIADAIAVSRVSGH